MHKTDGRVSSPQFLSFFTLIAMTTMLVMAFLVSQAVLAPTFAQTATSQSTQNPLLLFMPRENNTNQGNEPASSAPSSRSGQATSGGSRAAQSGNADNVPAPQAAPAENATTPSPSRAEERRQASFQDQITRKVNRNVLGLISGTTNGTYITIASDISQVLDDGDAMRIIPIVGKGGAQNIRDLLFLRGVDMAIVQSDAREVFSKDDNFRPLLRNLRYITKLYNEELHVYASKDIQTLRDLDGKKVNISDMGSGTNVTMRRVFEQLRITPEIQNMGQLDAYEAMKNGDLDATVLIAGKPSGAFSKFEQSDEFHLVPIQLSDINSNHFVPSVFTHEDYPELIAPGDILETVAVEAILVAYNWPKGNDRRRRLDDFIEVFFNNIDEFRKAPRHPKWKETNIAAKVPLWTRMETAQVILDEMRQEQATGSLQNEFSTYLESQVEGGGSSLNDASKEKLFQQFMEWKKRQE
jgi:TRAP transporter TAXI family solute receptor